MDDMDVILAKLYRLRATLKQVLSEDEAAIFNLPASTRNKVARETILLKAFRQGLVRLRSENGREMNKPELDQLVATALSSHSIDKVEVKLTKLGGTLWEKRASPMWDYFLDEGAPRVLRGDVWIFFEAKSQTWLRCVDQTFKRFGFFRTNQRRIVPKRLWQPVYWKQFRLGYLLGINTGHRADSPLGERFLQGIATADGRLADTFSVLAGIWDARWVSSLR